MTSVTLSKLRASSVGIYKLRNVLSRMLITLRMSQMLIFLNGTRMVVSHGPIRLLKST